MPFNELTVINEIAAQERSISGIKNAFDYAKNPDALRAVDLPAVIHYIPAFTTAPEGHYNLWVTRLVVKSILYFTPREAQGGKLKFLENDCIPYGQKWRTKFSDSTVISDLLANTSSVKAFLSDGVYGAGGDDLTFGGVAFLGWVFQFTFKSA